MRQVSAHRRVIATVAAAVGLLVLGSGCGVPSQAQPQVVPSTAVPFGLLDPSTPVPSDPSPSSTTSLHAETYFVDQDRLIGVRRPLVGTTPRQRLESAIRALQAGPSEAELADGVSTSIPTQLRLRVVGLENRMATIALAGEAQNLGTEDKLAVAQIVLTAASVDGVASVRLVRDGEPISAPLSDGSLSDQPLGKADYFDLTRR
ncbi:MAG TPA: GerMN domain-containing protein [Actinopolymorphaceae bacterium]